jgi:hypothetical protein
MPRKQLDPDNLAFDEDWIGNNAAFTCPVCQKVFIVSGLLSNERPCPNCGKSKGFVSLNGGPQSGGQATIEWPDNE